MQRRGIYARRHLTEAGRKDFDFLSGIQDAFPRRLIKPHTLGRLAVTITEGGESGGIITRSSTLRHLSPEELKKKVIYPAGNEAAASSTKITVHSADWMGQDYYRRRLVLRLDPEDEQYLRDYYGIADQLPGYGVKKGVIPHLTLATADRSFTTDDVLEWANANAPQTLDLAHIRYTVAGQKMS